MKKIQIIFLTVALTISILALGLSFLKNKEQVPASTDAIPQIQTDQQAKDFTLTSIEGQTFPLSSLKGNVILLSFWASWCGPCLSEIPYMVRLYHHFKNENFKIVLVNVEDEPAVAVNEFAPKLNITFENYYSADGKGPEVYQVSGIPHNVLIDKNFNVVFTEKGPRNWYGEEVITLVQDLIKK